MKEEAFRLSVPTVHKSKRRLAPAFLPRGLKVVSHRRKKARMKKVVAPQLGRITHWYVQEGGTFQPGQRLVRIELRDIQGHVSLLPKNAHDVKVHRVLCPVGATIEKGQALALIGPSIESTPDFELGPEHLSMYTNAEVTTSAALSIRRLYRVPLLLALSIEALLLVCLGAFLFVTARTVPSWSWNYISMLLSLSRPWQVLTIVFLFSLRFLPKSVWQRFRKRGERP